MMQSRLNKNDSELAFMLADISKTPAECLQLIDEWQGEVDMCKKEIAEDPSIVKIYGNQLLFAETVIAHARTKFQALEGN